jgi:hypothetical protein
LWRFQASFQWFFFFLLFHASIMSNLSVDAHNAVGSEGHPASFSLKDMQESWEELREGQAFQGQQSGEEREKTRCPRKDKGMGIYTPHIKIAITGQIIRPLVQKSTPIQRVACSGP